MRRSIQAVMGACMLSMLFGCDWFAQKELKPGESSVDDVRRLMGRPEMIWEEKDGSQVLEYPRGPAGHQTYMVEIGPDGRFRAMRNVLVRESFEKVRAGMTRDDLRRLLGKPTETAQFPLKQEEVWSWRYQAEASRSLMFNAHLDPSTGRVRSVSTTPDPQTINSGG